MLHRTKFIFGILLLGDALILYASLIIVLFLRYGGETLNSYIWNLHWPPFTGLFIVWLLVFQSLGLYEISTTKNERRFTERLARAVLFNAIFGIVFFYGVPSLDITPRASLFLLLFISVALIFIWRHIFNLILSNSNPERILFMGLSPEVSELALYLKSNPQFGLSSAAFMSSPDEGEFGLSPLYPIEKDVKDIITKHGIQIIVISKNIADNAAFIKIFFEMLPLGVRVIHFPLFYETITGKIPVSLITESWFLENFADKKYSLYEKGKRVFDILLSLLFLIPTILLLPFIATAIILSTPRDILRHRELRARPGDGMVLFKQRRVGKGGTSFSFMKFRSQVLGAEKMGEKKELAEDPRQYPIGKFLRKSYVDELPQIMNVLRGEMSFIGPRPERPEYVALLKQKVPFYEMRHMVAPGLTGWAQINMKNDASVEDALEKIQYDLYYIKNRSFSLDLDIFLRTIVVVLSRSGR